MLQPKRTKFRKAFKGRIHGNAKGGTELNFGAFGLKAMEPERITARQIEAARRAITRHIKRQGRLWIRIFPDVPVSSKPAEVRMRIPKRGFNNIFAKDYAEVNLGAIQKLVDAKKLETKGVIDHGRHPRPLPRIWPGGGWPHQLCEGRQHRRLQEGRRRDAGLRSGMTPQFSRGRQNEESR